MKTKSGCILLNKPVGITSRQAGVIVGKYFKTRKIGHLGTLDPFAEGLLLIMVNKATKIAPFIKDEEKSYQATIKLGNKTDTGDLTGNIIESKDIPNLDKDKIHEVLKSFLGKSSQIPPMYSAIKVNGEHLYDLARSGEVIERKPRDIEVKSIELNSFNNDEIVFTCLVSKGTYIRTLGEDIATKLGSVGHLTKLVRLSIGDYSLYDSINVGDLNDDSLIGIENILKYMDVYEVKDHEEKLALNGGELRINKTFNNPYILIKNSEGLIAVYYNEYKNVYKCVRGLR